MDPSAQVQDAEALQQRIDALERELEEARGLVAERPRTSIESLRHQLTNHQAQLNLAKYGRSDNVVFVDPKKEHAGELPHYHYKPPSKLHMFFHNYNFTEFANRPILHQWFQNGTIYREARERVSSRFELFFDLLFVGIVHQLAESAAEQPNGLGLTRFILTFAFAFSVWGDVRDLGNQFGNDDVTQRVYFIWIMALLVGYSNNAFSVQLFAPSQQPTEEGKVSLRWTFGFIAAAKFSKVLLNIAYGFFLPLSRVPLLVSALNPLFITVLLFIAIFVQKGSAIYTLASIAIASEYALKVVGVLFSKWAGIRLTSRVSTMVVSDKGDIIVDGSQMTSTEKVTKLYRFPAINIEHHVDRLGAFITINLGEMVANIFFTVDTPAGLSAQCGRAILGLMIAFNLNWIYFDSEACRSFVHALRRHWITGLLFTFLHLPLSLSLLLASAAMNRLVVVKEPPSSGATISPITAENDVAPGIYWFFGVGVGLSVICMATIGLLHRSLDEGRHCGVLRISRPVVIGTRYATGTVMILLPLARQKLGPTNFLAAYVALTAFLIIEETFSRLERVQRQEDEAAAFFDK